MAKASSLEAVVMRPGDSFEEWDRFVDESPQGCIFCRSWWLDAVCDGQFEVLTVRQGGRIVAGIPLCRKRKLTLLKLAMPPLTPTLGVLLACPEAEKYESQLSNEMDVLSALLRALPRADYFVARMHHAFTNWLPFYWGGYTQTTRYTYVIEDVSDLQRLRADLSSRTRKAIRKAEKSGVVAEESTDLGAFLGLNKKTFGRQGVDVPYSDLLVEKLDRACAARGARSVFLARGADQRLHAALYVVHDSLWTCGLMSGGDPELRSSGANDLLMWKWIEMAHKRNLRVNFQGSMMANVEFFLRGFGAVQKPYFEITRDNRPFYAKAYSTVRRHMARIVRKVGIGL